MPIPTLSPEQLQAARKAATEARRARAELKEQVRTGSLTLGQALDKAASDDVLAHVKVVDLLKALPRVGEKRAAEIMERLEIAPNRRVRGLGRHQVAGLKAEFA
ncbi:MAG TPA: integration host factor, actinobacterial type [Propionibacteriaceae bacterium]|nr:integration host factor, actinobacterial type [Propionibacteriaceae bacterium]HEX2857046.1 integration host factor, actinobacterial type [Propionibacteriaceae bacterium]